jgi:hypothetical protein
MLLKQAFDGCSISMTSAKGHEDIAAHTTLTYD